MRLIITIFTVLFIYSCTPIKSSSGDNQHKMELTIHEVQTNIDDMRHDLNCFKTDLQIVDHKVAKQSMIAKKNENFSKLAFQIKEIETKLSQEEKSAKKLKKDVESLFSYADKTNESFLKYKNKLGEIETALLSIDKRFEKLDDLKNNLKKIATSLQQEIIYQVKAGDTLGEIANRYSVHLEDIKKINDLKEDLIVIGQELRIPK